MADCRIEVGWNVAVIGGTSMTILESVGGGSTSVSISTGTYCHTDISSIVAGYTDWATALKAALEAASPNALTYTVTWDEAAQDYTLSVSSGTFSMTFTNATDQRNMRRILGFSATQSTAASHSSDQQPWYARPLVTSPEDVSDEYEPGGVSEDVEGPSGAAVGMSWEAWPTYWDFTIRYEPREVMHTHLAASDEVWCWDAMVKHCRNKEPFFLRNDWANSTGENTVHFLRAPARFVPTASHPDSEQLWDLAFETRYKGDI